MPLKEFLKNKKKPVQEWKRYSFFPGCTLKTSGHENTSSLLKFCKKVKIKLFELEDWNCCGSSSAHSINHEVGENLPLRNISLIPAGMPLMIACPSCFIRMKQAYLNLKKDEKLRQKYEEDWKTVFNPNLEIIHFFEIFSRIKLSDYIKKPRGKLNNIKVAPYYGCMLFMPPDLRHGPSFHGLMEKTLSGLGADMISFGYRSKCCGTYLSVAKPKIAENAVNEIVSKAMEAGAECLVTACSMCHLNIEIRCTIKDPIPILHFSELLSMALGAKSHKKWFPRHIVDPVPLLKKRNLL